MNSLQDEELDLKITDEKGGGDTASPSKHGTRHSANKQRDQLKAAIQARVLQPGLGQAPLQSLRDFLNQHGDALFLGL